MLDRARVVYRVAAAGWLGAVVFLCFALSPVAFGLLPAADIGVLLGWAVRRVFPAAMAAGAITAGSLAWRTARGDRQHLRARAALVAGALVLCGLALWLGLRMDGLQEAGGPGFWQLPAGAEERQAFDRLHRDAVGMLGVALLILVVIVGLG